MAKGVLISFIIIAIGIAWLLNTLHFIGGVDWLWTFALAAAGIFALAWGKMNKLTFVMGAFLLIGSIFSILRQVNAIRLEVEVPLLVVIFGILFLVAQLPMIPHTATVASMIEEAKLQKKPD
jgi:hypothetical protein